MKKLYLGSHANIEIPQSPFLYIHDEIPAISRARVFDVSKHFNPLKDISYLRARELTEIFYSVYPQGADTLTLRDGKRALTRALLHSRRLDKLEGTQEVKDLMDDVLLSPVLRSILTTTKHFSFKTDAPILARINRAELGDRDALILGLLLISMYKGQMVIPDVGFYGRDIHISLLRQNRLIAGVRYLDQLPLQLKNELLLVEDKVAKGALYRDAVVLAELAGLRPDPLREDSPYNRFIDASL